jgi:hypothetical protein
LTSSDPAVPSQFHHQTIDPTTTTTRNQGAPHSGVSQDAPVLRDEVERLKARVCQLEQQLAETNLHVPVHGEAEQDQIQQNLENSEDSQPLEPVTELLPNQISRYSRQLLLQDGFGVEGQRKLLSSSVLVIGAGGIGSTGV